MMKLSPIHLSTLSTLTLVVAACAPPESSGSDTNADENDGVITLDGTSDGDDDESGGSEGESGGSEGSEGSEGSDSSGEDTTTTTTTTDGDPLKFDLGAIPDGNGNTGCAAPPHTPCDGGSNDPFHAFGVNCPGEYQVTAQYTGHPDALYVHTGQLGTYNPATYPTLEGDKMLIMSSGIAQEMTVAGLYASTANPGNDPVNLPAPLVPTAVDPGLMTDCYDDPNLVGTGDCSNTVQEQWNQGNGAYDYAELRMTGTVPGGASGFSYNLAFFSTEYPVFYQSSFNDMYIAWLVSEEWTGNVSFDEMGKPISLNAGFLDYKDAPNNEDCPDPCTAPELQGTAMEGHAGTKWLTTSAGVQPGEDFTLVLAIFDLSDNILDSIVILDNFEWNCDGGPPITIPG